MAMATWFAAQEVKRGLQPGLVVALVVLGGIDLGILYAWVMVGWGAVEMYREVRGRAKARWWAVRRVGRPAGTREEAMGEIEEMWRARFEGGH